MMVYRVKNEYLGSDCVWERLEDALEEFNAFFDCGHEDVTEPNTITLSIEEMTEEQFEALPEFEGY